MLNWRTLYYVTVLQTDSSKMRQLIVETEELISRELGKLTADPHDDRERKEMTKVLAALSILKSESECWHSPASHFN